MILPHLVSANLILVFLVRAWTAGAQLVMGVIVAKFASLEVAGLFYVLLTCIFACAAIGKYGYDESLIKIVAVQCEHNAHQAIFNATQTALAISAVVSLVVVFAFGQILPLSPGEVFNRLGNGLPSTVYAPLVVLFVGCWILGGALKGCGKPVVATLVQSGLWPLIFCLCLYTIWLQNLEIDLATLANAMLASFVLSFIAGYVYFCFHISRWFNGNFRLALAGQFEQLRFTAISLSAFVYRWGAVLVIAHYLTIEDVTKFNFEYRLALIVNFLLVVVNSVYTPRFAVANHLNNTAMIQGYLNRLFTILVVWGIAMAAMVYIASWFLPDLLSSQTVGPGLILAFLIIGQLFNVCTGPAGSLLKMSGNEIWVLYSLLLSMTVTTAVVFMLVPIIGLLGASIGVCVGLIVQNGMNVVMVSRKLRVSTVPLTFYRSS